MVPGTSSVSSRPNQSPADRTLADRGQAGVRDLSLDWTNRLSLTHRILAVNFFVVALLGGGLFYLDNYRARLVETRIERLARETRLLAATLDEIPAPAEARTITRFAKTTGTRVRLYASDGTKIADSFAIAAPTYQLRDPADEGIRRQLARSLDRAVEAAVGASSPDYLREPVNDRATAWPELRNAANAQRVATNYRFAPDRSPFLSAAIGASGRRPAMLVTENGRDITRIVRAERYRLGLVLAIVLVASVLLSLFLARTIVRPVRRLMKAAIRVRQGRSREVTVPRLPARRDEIGLLARAISDMTQALRERIDAGEHFAADVAHELKNPIASLRSSIEGLQGGDDPATRGKLLAIAADDCRRLDRLVTDIAEASRMDAELSRARFEPIDLGSMLDAMVAARRARQRPGDAKIAFARPRKGVTTVMGDDSRLERVFNNLIDNARSFTDAGGLICITATRVGSEVIVRVEDDGPGIPPERREEIFHRFHTLRPEAEQFGDHSGLGLAIARAIVEGHLGSIHARDRDNGEHGACIEIRLPPAMP